MKQKIEIEVPNGKKAIWKDGTIIFEDSKLPKTWEEFCILNPHKTGEYYISSLSSVCKIQGKGLRSYTLDKNAFISEEAARQHIALMQLHRLRDCYRQGWKPVEGELNYNIYNKYEDSVNDFRIGVSKYPTFLSFPTRELAFEFLENFKYLLVEAKELI